MTIQDMGIKSKTRTSKYQNEWLDIIDNDIIKNNTKTISIPIGLTKTFLGNFYGLLNNDLSIGPDFWYPHLLINNFNSSLDYSGETEIKIIESAVLENCLNIFKKQK